MKFEKSYTKCSCGRELPMHWYEEGLAVNKAKSGRTCCIYCAESEEDMFMLSSKLKPSHVKNSKSSL